MGRVVHTDPVGLGVEAKKAWVALNGKEEVARSLATLVLLGLCEHLMRSHVCKRALAEQKPPTSQLLSHKFVQQHVETLMNAASPAVAARNTDFLSSPYCFSRECAYLAHCYDGH